MTQIILVLLAAIASPLPLIIIEKILPFPFLIEEILKLIAVLILLRQTKIIKRDLLPIAIIVGLLFAVSESIFYLINILSTENFNIFYLRLLLTSTLHMLTIGIIYVLAKRGVIGIVAGLTTAILIHYFYNLLIPALL